MPKVSRPESSKPTTTADAIASDSAQKKKSIRRSKPGSRSKKEIKKWENVSTDRLPIRFQRITRITHEILMADIVPMYKDDLGDKKPKFRRGFMHNVHEFINRRLIRETRSSRKLQAHAKRSTLMNKDFAATQDLIADLS